MKIAFGVIILMVWGFAAQAQTTETCKELGQQMNQQVVNWDYTKFENEGWRILANKKCFFSAGSSIVAWLSANLETVTAEQARTLRYHAARVFAMTGRTRIAVIHLTHAKNLEQDPEAAQDWNSFIDVFSGWLRRDVADIRAGIEKLELQQVDETGYKPNLIAAKRFLICYSLPYSAIETDPQCIEKPKKVEMPELRQEPESDNTLNTENGMNQ
ncbi:MAG: hypothetical protein L3J04_03985 [Robiginitomaculum sp.]|nr:hypothetical protein [Robiginitomaculum sp.]